MAADWGRGSVEMRRKGLSGEEGRDGDSGGKEDNWMGRRHNRRKSS